MSRRHYFTWCLLFISMIALFALFKVYQDKKRVLEVEKAHKTLNEIVTLQRKHHFDNHRYVEFEFGQDCENIGFVHPENTPFVFSFKNAIAMARRKEGNKDDIIMLEISD